MVVAFVDDHGDRFGVEPICHVLTELGVPIAPHSYYAQRVRPPAARAVRDERVLAEIVRVHIDPKLGRGLSGSARSETESVVGREVPLRVDLVLDGVHRLRLRRLWLPHRGVAHCLEHADGVAARRVGDGGVDPPA